MNPNIILECIQCGNRWHSQCHEQQNGNNGGQQGQLNWTCTNCTIQRTAKFGYHTSGHTYSLNEYQQRALQFKNNKDLSPSEWENIFWSIVDNGCCPLSVEYGSEVPSSKEITGFPMENIEDPITWINYGCIINYYWTN